MALSRLQKGLIGAGIAIVAVIAIGYGGMRYIEHAVVGAIRTWAAQTPPDAKVELGDVSYTLLENHLVLKNIRVHYAVQNAQAVDATVETLDILHPGATLLALVADPKSEIKDPELPVADTVTMSGISIGPDPKIAIQSRTISRITLSAEAARTLFSEQKPDSAQIALAVMYGLAYKDDNAVGITVTTRDMPFTVESFRLTNYDKGHLDAFVTSGIALSAKGQKLFTLGEFRMDNLTLPPREVTAKLLAAPAAITEKEAMELAKGVFTGKKPLIASISLSKLKTSSSLFDVSLAKMTFNNPTTDPYAFDVSLEHLKLPVAFVPELQNFSIMGVTELDASASYALSLPGKDNRFDTMASLAIGGFGTADLDIKGGLPYDAFMALVEKTAAMDSDARDQAIQDFMETNLTLSHVEFGYADEGLLPRLGILGQKFMGLSPEQCVLLAKKYAREEIGAESPEDIAKVDSFIDRPGAIRFTFAPEKPLSVRDAALLPPNAPAFKLDVNPGPKTVLELISALDKK